MNCGDYSAEWIVLIIQNTGITLNHPDIYATSAHGTSATLHPITAANWNKKIVYGAGTYCLMKALEINTATQTPKADTGVPILIHFQYNNPTYSSSSYRNCNISMNCDGNMDGFVSFAELDLAAKGTIERITYLVARPDTSTTQYFSTLPNYCAFGKLT